MFRLCKFFLLLTFLFLTACSSIIDSHKQKKPLMVDYEVGELTKLTQKINQKLSSTNGSGDQLMWNLEAGTVFFQTDKYQKSLEQFVKAENLIKNYDSRASINARGVGAEIGSAFTNLNALPYKGFCYDRIMLNCYKALNYFALGKNEDALVELRRLRNTQKEITKHFRHEIAKYRKEAEQKNSELTNQVSENSIANSISMQNIYKKINANNEKSYGNLLNPFATYFSAIGYLYEGNKSEALVDFRNLYRMEKNNDYVNQKYVQLATELNEEIPKELTKYLKNNNIKNSNLFVIFANGRTAAYKQNKFWLILPYVGYTGLAFPSIVFNRNDIAGCNVLIDNKKFTMAKLASMDSVISEEYKNLLAPMITRIAVSYVTKEVASYAAVRAVQENKKNGNDLAEIATYVGTGIYKYIFNTADTRSWELLPKEYYVAQLPIPKNHTLKLQALPNGGNLTLKLKNETSFAIIYIRSNSHKVLTAKVFELK